MNRLMAIGLLVLVAGGNTSYGQYYGRGGGGGGGRASTPAQAYAYGVSSIVRSQGQYNVMTAQAAVAAEQANQLAIQNRVAATKAYFEMRQINKDYQASQRGQASQQSMAQYYEQQKPRKLSPSQLDPVTGQIGWPALLKDETYQPYREQLEPMFKIWAHHQDLSFNEVRKASDSMLTELRKHINDLPPQEFEEAQKFIEALAFEAHFPAA
ncbi:MAG TPA: hypothetical protein VHY20_09010 [Pirellulales bacterium]|jgi:hypothetical protein|nr:hypothetical protein [Pirellulales bacterium]